MPSLYTVFASMLVVFGECWINHCNTLVNVLNRRCSLQHGADVNRRNRDNLTPLDMVKGHDSDIADLLRGDDALLDASKKGDLDRVKKLVTPENINCRDEHGRNSTPLHLAGTYTCILHIHLQCTCIYCTHALYIVFFWSQLDRGVHGRNNICL